MPFSNLFFIKISVFSEKVLYKVGAPLFQILEGGTGEEF